MSIQFTESGKGYPVVLIHGFCESSEIWKDFSDSLSKNHRVICPDLPGFGNSAPLPLEPSIDMVANSVYDILQKKNISECIIIGHSLGGYVTLEIAKKFPNIVSGIGLFHSTAFADTEEKKENRNKSIEFIQKHGVDKFIDSFVPMLFHPDSRERLSKEIQQLVEIGKLIPEKTITDYMVAMRDRDDNIEFLKEFDKPLLFIFGEEDTSIPVARSKEQIKWMQHPYLKRLPETGHMGMFERKEETLKAVSTFVDVTIR
jgi:pimeloyl-ACP methyl ester carboxylesterase